MFDLVQKKDLRRSRPTSAEIPEQTVCQRKEPYNILDLEMTQYDDLSK